MKYELMAVVLLGMVVAGGCASKKYVRSQVDPVSQRVDELEAENEQQAGSIEELEGEVSLALERAETAGHGADQAALAARKAAEQADEAREMAAAANSLAETGHSRLNEFGRALDSLDDYELAHETMVLFALESASLDEDAKRKLDQAVASVPANGRSVIEVRGFTDTTGSASYNLALSERRASTVARYLAGQHDTPLRQIYMLGLGSEEPQADNMTREGRKMNRRVEVKVYVAGQAEFTAVW